MNSPLWLERSNLIRFEIRRSGLDQVLDGDELKTVCESAHRHDTDRRWRIVLTVQFGGTVANPTAPVVGRVEIEGYFEVHSSYPVEKTPQLVRVNGPSILLGSARELVALVSGRTTHGVFLLPSMSFFQPATSDARQSKNVGNRRVLESKKSDVDANAAAKDKRKTKSSGK